MALKLNEIFPKLIQDIKILEKAVIRTGGERASEYMKEDIVKSIERGQSPVEGEKRFEKYSKSYTTSIKKGRYPGKKIRPVNLKLTGDLLKSIKSKLTSNGFSIFFSKTVNGKNLAEIHSFEGAGKSKTIRKILPEQNEEYKKSIKRRATEHLVKVTNNELEKYLRRF